MKVLRILIVAAICMVANKAEAWDHATAAIYAPANAVSYNAINNYESMTAYTKAGHHSNNCTNGGCCTQEATCCNNIWAGFCGEKHHHCCKPWFQIKERCCCMPKLCMPQICLPKINLPKLCCMKRSCCKPACDCEAKAPSCDCQAKAACSSCNPCGGHIKMMLGNAYGRMHCLLHRCKSLCSCGCDAGCSDCGTATEEIHMEVVPEEKAAPKKDAPKKPELDKSVNSIELFPKLSALNSLLK